MFLYTCFFLPNRESLYDRAKPQQVISNVNLNSKTVSPFCSGTQGDANPTDIRTQPTTPTHAHKLTCTREHTGTRSIQVSDTNGHPRNTNAINANIRNRVGTQAHP